MKRFAFLKALGLGALAARMFGADEVAADEVEFGDFEGFDGAHGYTHDVQFRPYGPVITDLTMKLHHPTGTVLADITLLVPARHFPVADTYSFEGLVDVLDSTLLKAWMLGGNEAIEKMVVEEDAFGAPHDAPTFITLHGRGGSVVFRITSDITMAAEPRPLWGLT